MNTPYRCLATDAPQIADWLKNRGGILLWPSVNLSNLHTSWSTPAHDSDGKPVGKPNWQAAREPGRHITDPADVEVSTPKEVERLKIKLRVSSSGLYIKLTDASAEKLRARKEYWREKTGASVFHTFAHEREGLSDTAIIWADTAVVPLTEWLKANPVKIIECGGCSHWHRVDYHGDCRNDAERFADPEDAAKRLGRPVVEVDAAGTVHPDLFLESQKEKPQPKKEP